MRKILLALGLTSLLLAGCNTTQTPSQIGDGGGTKVTVSASFPTETKPTYPPKPPYPWLPSKSPGDLKPQGIPGGVDGLYATLKVYRGVNLVTQATLTPSQPSATLSLTAGAAYRFELTVKSTPCCSNTEYDVAWAETTQYIAGDTTLNLVPRAIIGQAYLEAPYYPSNLNEESLMGLRLWVVSPAGWSPNFPIDDYSVTYEPGYWEYSPRGTWDFVPSGDYLTIEAQSKIGVLVRAKPGSGGQIVGVRAKVTGLGSNFLEKEVLAFTAIPVIPLLPENDNIFIESSVKNWPLEATLSAQIVIRDYINNQVTSSTGEINPLGEFLLNLPAGNAIRNHFMLLPLLVDPPGCFTSWTIHPGVVNIFFPSLFVQANNQVLGRLILASSEIGIPEPGYKEAMFVYADRDTTGQGTQTCTYGGVDPVTATYEYNFNLRKGWNLLVVEYTAQGGVVTGGPNGGTLPQGLNWYLTSAASGNANVGIELDFSPPYGYIWSPSSNTSRGYGSVVLINGDANDDRAVADIRLYANAQEIPVTITSGALGTPSVYWQASWNPPAPGFYFLDLIVVDRGGNAHRNYTSVWVR